jgi:hypothetical protein
VKSDEYHDKPRKYAAMESLREEMKQFDEDVTVDEIQKKLNSIRASYRRELKKHCKKIP